jgi:MEMO1 family protein
MNIRPPVRAGTFYDADPAACRRHVDKLAASAPLPPNLPPTLYGGIVPHAGWIYSGTLAALTIKALLADQAAPTLVLFGADHTGSARKGEVYESGIWQTPLGDVQIDQELASAILSAGDGLRSNPAAHAYEHSLEVQVPLIRFLGPAVRIVPIAVPPTPLAVTIGQAVGRVLATRFPKVRVVGSTDLTHHAGHFPAPGGRGIAGVEWTERNDQRMLHLLEAMDAPGVIAEALAHENACGAGAAAATVAACKELGAGKGVCLGYTNSYRVVHRMDPHDPDDTTVGYASVVFA